MACADFAGKRSIFGSFGSSFSTCTLGAQLRRRRSLVSAKPEMPLRNFGTGSPFTLHRFSSPFR